MAKLGPLPDVPGVVKIRLLGKTSGNTNWANVLHAQVSGTLSAANLTSAATAIRGYWVSDLASSIHLSTTLKVVEITDLTSRTGAQGVDNTGAAGTLSGSAATANNAACLTLKIANRYRGGHPRLYMPGLSTVASTDGVNLATAYAANYQTAGRAFLAHINGMVANGLTWKLCAVSYYHKVGLTQAYKTPPEVYIITDVLCHGRVDSMRSRLGKESS